MAQRHLQFRGFRAQQDTETIKVYSHSFAFMNCQLLHFGKKREKPNVKQLWGEQKVTALEKVLLLVSFRKNGKLSVDDKSEVCWEELLISSGRNCVVLMSADNQHLTSIKNRELH